MGTPFQRGQWTGKLGFILAGAGSAIGLGNIWKFPYMIGVSGGGAFVFIYLLAILLLGLPIIMSEFLIGKSTQKNPVGAFKILSPNKPFWLVGAFGVICACIIMSFYSVVAGWSLHFIYEAVLGFSGGDGEIQGIFGKLYENGLANCFWHTVFMLFCVGIVVGGIKDGLEKYNKILMPALFLILILLMIYSLMTEGAMRALSFLFKPDFSKITPQVVLDALGQAFFTLSLGVGTMITYGSYLKKETQIPSCSFTIVGLDTVIAIMAGIVIFPIVFTFDIEPSSGPGLIFSSLPVLFSKIPFGYFFSIAFFVLLFFAALTSAVSLLEVPVAYLIDEWKISRRKATIGVGLAIYLLGIACSFDNFGIFGMSFFEIFDKAATNVIMPLGGLMITIFAGYFISQKVKEEYFPDSWKPLLLKVYDVLIKTITPILILIVLIAKIYELF
ncbi:MAG: sodium-dependent transporter [Pseudomonadota bacterium]